MCWNSEGGSITWKAAETFKPHRELYPLGSLSLSGTKGWRVLVNIPATVAAAGEMISPASAHLGIFFPSLFKGRKIINKASSDGSTGSREKGLLKDIKLSLGDRDVDDPEQNQFRIWNATQDYSSAPAANIFMVKIFTVRSSWLAHKKWIVFKIYQLTLQN